MEDDGRVLDIPLLYVLFLDINLCDCIPYFFYTESSARIGKASKEISSTRFSFVGNFLLRLRRRKIGLYMYI